MGNESSTPSEAEQDLYQINLAHPLHRPSTGKHLIDSDDEEAGEHDHLHVSHRRRGVSGSLKGSVIAVATTNGPSSSGFVDPVLSAAAAGAAARKAKHQKRKHSNPFRQHSKKSSNNEWKKSLQRLAKTAASTATNVAHVTVPILADAGSIVVESAKEFATDVQDEFSKPKYTEAEEGAESVIMFPYSPGRSWSNRTWQSPFTVYDPDLSPTTPKTGQSDSMGRVRIDLKVKNHAQLTPILKPTPSTGHNDGAVTTQQQERESNNKSKRSVQIAHFPELAKMHTTEVVQRDANRALPETILNGEDTVNVDESTLSSTTDNQNGEMTISLSQEECIGITADGASSPNAQILLNNPLEDAEDIEFAKLTEAIFKDDIINHDVDSAVAGTATAMHIITKSEESEEVEFSPVNGAAKDNDLKNTEDSAIEDTNAEVYVSTTSEDSEDIEFAKLTEAIFKDDDLKDAEDSGEIEFASISGAAEDNDLKHAEDSTGEARLDELKLANETVVEETSVKMRVGTTLEESEKIAFTSTADTVTEDKSQQTEDSAAIDVTDEKRSLSETGAQNNGHDYQVVGENNGEESTSADDIKDLDIFDEFQQLVESAAKEGVFFSLENEDSMAAMDFEDVNAEIERELGDTSDPLDKEVEPLKPLEKELREASRSLDKELSEPNKAPTLTTAERKSNHDEAILETIFNNGDNDEDFSQRVGEVPSNDSEMARDEENYPPKKDYQDVSTAMTKFGADQELRALLERVENGEVVDEDRLYELELFERYQSGEILTQEETEDLNSLLKWKQTLDNRDSITVGEKNDHGEKSNAPSLFDTNTRDGQKSFNQDATDKIPTEPLVDSTADANNDACENARTNETTKELTLATPSDRENPWLYWSFGRKGSESCQMSTERLSSILSIADPEAIPEKGIVGRDVWSGSREVPHVDEGWRYWAHVDEDTGNKHQIEVEEIMPLPEDSIPMLRAGTETITKSASLNGPGWLYWSQAELGQPEHDFHTSSSTGDVEIRTDSMWQEIVTSSSNKETLTDAESGWRYWALLAQPRQSAQGHSEKKGRNPARHIPVETSKKGVLLNKDSLSPAQNGVEDVQIEEILSLTVSEQPNEGDLPKENFVRVVKDCEEETRFEDNIHLSDSEAPNGDQSAKDSVPVVQKGDEETRFGEYLPLVRSSAHIDSNTGWMFWSMLDERSSQKIVVGNNLLRDFKETTAPNEVQLEENRSREVAKHACKPRWLHWAQLEDAKTSEAKAPLQHSIHRSEVQDVVWNQNAIEDSIPSWDFEYTTVPDEVRLASLHWAQVDQRKTSDSKILEREPIQVSAQQSSESQPIEPIVPMISTPAWLYWSELGLYKTKKDAEFSSLSWDVRLTNDPQEVQLQKPRTVVVGEEASKPGWLHWAQVDQLEAPDSKLQQQDFASEEKSLDSKQPQPGLVSASSSEKTISNSKLPQHDSVTSSVSEEKSPDSKLPRHGYGSMSDEKLMDYALNASVLRFDDPEWLYWSTVGGDVVHKTDEKRKYSSDLHDATAFQEVQVQDLAEQSTESTWLYWAQMDRTSFEGSRQLDYDTSPTAEYHPHEALQEETRSDSIRNPGQEKTLSESRPNVEALVENDETSTSKMVPRGMKTRSQTYKHGDGREPLTIGNSRVARELHTSYNPVTLKKENRLEEESSNTALLNGRAPDISSDLRHDEMVLSGVDSSNDKLKEYEGAADGRTSRHHKDGYESSHPQTPNAQTESSVTDDEFCSSLNQPDVDGENGLGDDPSDPSSSLKEVVGMFARISAESKKAIKIWNGINQGKENEKQSSGPQTADRHMLHDAQRISKLASDLAGEVLRKGPAGLFSARNESLQERTGSTTVEVEKSTEKRSDIEVDIALQSEPFSTDFAVDLLSNPREMLDAAVSKFAADLSINEKQQQKSWNKVKRALPDSIFKYETSSRSPTSISSVESVPIEDSDRYLGEEPSANDIAVSWDLMPSKREILHEHNFLQLPKNRRNVGSSFRVDGEVPLPRQKQRAGTKTKPLDNTRNHGSTDVEILSPMMSPKARRSKRSSRSLFKLQSEEFDDLSSRLSLELESAESSVVEGTTEVKGFDQMNDPESLGLALVSFSSIDSIDFLRKIPTGPRKQEGGQSLLFWKVLITNWKHSQTWKSMTTRSLSLNDDWLERDSRFQETGESIDSSSTIRFQFRNKRIGFSSAGHDRLRSPNPQSRETSTLILSEYLCDIGPHHLGSADENVESVIRHTFAQKDTAPSDVGSLLKLAESYQQSFAKLLGDIATFASLENSRSETKHSFGLKQYTAIRSKADRKYGGDIMQVKDTIRGQITFPDETSLICGLLCLHRKCFNAARKEDMHQFEIVRLKNYFRTVDESDSSLAPMPTGYRHVLINIRIGGTMVAELQFQLAQLFEIMGADGYLLHTEILSSLAIDKSQENGSERKPPRGGIDLYDIAKNILLVDHIKGSKQAAKEEQQIQVRRVEKRGEIAIIAAEAGRERNGGNAMAEWESKKKKPNKGIGAVAASVAAAKTAGSKDSKVNAGRDVIGAIAATQATNGGNQMSTKKQEEFKFVGGIGTAAAASARGAMMSNFKASSKGEGISAVLAATALELKKGNLTPETVRKEQKPNGSILDAGTAKTAKPNTSKAILGGGGIAALAAAAAKNRSSKDGSSQNGRFESDAAEEEPSQANPSKSSEKINPSLTEEKGTLASHTREIDLIKDAMDVGIKEAGSNPRNLPAFYCLYLLLLRLEEIDPDYFSSRLHGNSEPRPPMRKIKTMLLTRCLAISNQASSLGMFGWLEYGSSNVVERSLGLPIEMMQRLAFNFASSGDWNKASDILSSCVMRCQGQLPLYHPTTLCTMIDLATTFTMTSLQPEGKALIKTVSDVVSEFLAECEAVFFIEMSKRFSFERDREQVFLVERTTSVISLLTSFAIDFNTLLSRVFLGLIDPNHQITLLNHSLVANSFAVLASCKAICQSRLSTDNVESESSLRYWSLAYLQYQYSLRGWTKLHSLSHPNAASAAFSVARCLRELGKIDESICFLESLLECLQHSSEQADLREGELEIEPRVLGTVSFLPTKSVLGNVSGISVAECRREQTIVLCLWTLAVFVVQRKHDEQARVHALKLLHEASDILRNLLYHADDMHEHTQRVCLELYTCVEEEARVLFEPLRMVQTMQTSEIKDQLMMNHQSSLTSMRRKRWFQQQQQQPTAGVSQLTRPVQHFI
ncbi:MAG: hypothetical protein SGBAC_006251 [Bacillariaceae sp.]